MKSNIIFFDDTDIRRSLLPLTYTRPTACLRLGITTIEQKWRTLLGTDATYSYLTVPYLKGTRHGAAPISWWQAMWSPHATWHGKWHSSTPARR